MWLYLVTFITILYALYKERQFLGCPTIPYPNVDCDNANGKAIRGTYPYPSDPIPVIAKKIREAANFGEKWVVWRTAFLISLPCILTIYFILYQRLPEEHEMIVGMFVITAIVYFTLNFYQFHLIAYAKKNIDEGVSILERRVLSHA